MQPKEVFDELKTILVARLKFDPRRAAEVAPDDAAAQGRRRLHRPRLARLHRAVDRHRGALRRRHGRVARIWRRTSARSTRCHASSRGDSAAHETCRRHRARRRQPLRRRREGVLGRAGRRALRDPPAHAHRRRRLPLPDRRRGARDARRARRAARAPTAWPWRPPPRRWTTPGSGAPSAAAPRSSSAPWAAGCWRPRLVLGARAGRSGRRARPPRCARSCRTSHAEALGRRLRLGGPRDTVVTACSSGAAALAVAAELIADGVVRRRAGGRRRRHHAHLLHGLQRAEAPRSRAVPSLRSRPARDVDRRGRGLPRAGVRRARPRARRRARTRSWPARHDDRRLPRHRAAPGGRRAWRAPCAPRSRAGRVRRRRSATSTRTAPPRRRTTASRRGPSRRSSARGASSSARPSR